MYLLNFSKGQIPVFLLSPLYKSCDFEKKWLYIIRLYLCCKPVVLDAQLVIGHKGKLCVFVHYSKMRNNVPIF